MKTPDFKLQVIVPNKQKWPYIGNGYLNRDGSITLLLDRAITLELPDGTRLRADGPQLVKLHARRPYAASQQAAPTTEAPE